MNNTNDQNNPEDLILEINGRRYSAPSLDRLKRYLSDYQDVSEKARALAVESGRYYDGDTLNERYMKKLEAMGLPSKSLNKVRKVVNSNVSTMLQQRTNPEATPRTSQAAPAADVATKMLRFALEKSNYKKTRSPIVEDFLIRGCCAVQVSDDVDSVPIIPISWREFFYDPRSSEYDFSDAEYMGIAKWMSVQTIRSRFPDAMERLGITSNGELMSVGEAYRDVAAEWMDKKARTIMVVEVHFKVDNTWVYVTFCHAGILDMGQKGYTDDDVDNPKSLCPILATSCYIKNDPDKSYDRYGIVKDLMPLQDEYVSHKAMANFAARDRRVQMDAGAIQLASQTKADTARKEANRPDGVIPPGWQIVPSTQFGEFASLLQISEREFNSNVPGPETLGLSGNASQSGVARQVAQQQGLTVIGPLLTRFSEFEGRIYEELWYRIRQFWTDEMEIRITGNEKTPSFLKINVPETQQVQVLKQDPGSGLEYIAIENQVVAIHQEVAQMDMDITFITVQEDPIAEREAYETMMRYTQGIPPLTPEWMAMIELCPSFPGKMEIVEKIKGKMEETQAQAQQAQQAQQQAAQEQQAKLEQVQVAQVQADLQDKQATAQKNMAHAAKFEAEATQIQNGAAQALYGDPQDYY